MSFSTDKGIPICEVVGGKADGEIIFVAEEDNNPKKTVIKRDPIRIIDCDDGKFSQLPNDKIRCVYIAGPSGSGKSTYVREYAKRYKKLFPKSKCFLLSRVDDDPSLDGFDYKGVVLGADLKENPLQIEEVTPDSMVIFDDIDAISNKKLLDSLIKFQSQILEMGRHMNIQCVITSHLIIGNARAQARTILNELHSLTVFPGSGSAAQISYALTKYFGLTKKQINKILAMNSRWVTLVKIYPQFVISEHQCIFVSNL